MTPEEFMAKHGHSTLYCALEVWAGKHTSAVAFYRDGGGAEHGHAAQLLSAAEELERKARAALADLEALFPDLTKDRLPELLRRMVDRPDAKDT